jgi:preprotein translocase subunit SecA
VVPIPTNRPPRRKRDRTRIFGSEQRKWESIVEEVAQLHAIRRPVLIGTRTIDKSEVLSKMLAERGIDHNVLNANHIAREAEIVAKAGEPLKVTVSTNMAGRGTDIKIPDEIKELGGLHVICTEMHDSGRIDRQLIGRCGRQGDPGTFRQYLSLDDELILSGFGPKKSRKLKDLGSQAGDREFRRFLRLFRRAQRRVERKHFRDRKAMMYFEKERKKMQRGMGQDPYLDTPN